MNRKILISACLLGEPVRYNGTGATSIHPILRQWQAEDRLIAVCPELLGGLPIPRSPAEVKGEGAGLGVLAGTASVVEKVGKDVTGPFMLGAQEVLTIVQQNNIRMAIMKARSPSCGSIQTYDGSFSSQLIAGQGVTSALLMQYACKVFNEEHLEEAAEWFRRIDV